MRAPPPTLISRPVLLHGDLHVRQTFRHPNAKRGKLFHRHNPVPIAVQVQARVQVALLAQLQQVAEQAEAGNVCRCMHAGQGRARTTHVQSDRKRSLLRAADASVHAYRVLSSPSLSASLVTALLGTGGLSAMRSAASSDFV